MNPAVATFEEVIEETGKCHHRRKCTNEQKDESPKGGAYLARIGVVRDTKEATIVNR